MQDLSRWVGQNRGLARIYIYIYISGMYRGGTDRFLRTGTDYFKERNGMDRNGFPDGPEWNRIARKIIDI